jgi:hypothetical protein
LESNLCGAAAVGTSYHFSLPPTLGHLWFLRCHINHQSNKSLSISQTISLTSWHYYNTELGICQYPVPKIGLWQQRQPKASCSLQVGRSVIHRNLGLLVTISFCLASRLVLNTQPQPHR